MRRWHRTLLALLAIGTATSAIVAQAAPKTPKRKLDEAVVANPTISASIDMPAPGENPSSTLILKQNELEPALTTLHSQLQVGVSSWLPRGLRLESQIPASAFDAREVPQISVALSSPLSDRPAFAGAIKGQFGIELATLTRTGSLGAGGVSSLSAERLYWIGFKFGGEWSPVAMQSRRVRPYLGAALVPSLLLSAPSIFSSGLALFALPVELGLGAEIQIGKLPILALGLEGKLVSVRGNNVSALGAVAGMRFPL